MKSHPLSRESLPSRRAPRSSLVRPTAPESFSDRVYRYLKEVIVSGQFPPGAQIFEDRLATELEISRTPVREAIQRLEFEDLVEIRPYKGTFVAQLDREGLRDVFEFREAVEGQAAWLATARMDEQTRASLNQLLEQFDRSVSADDPQLFHEADTRLHRILIEACGNRKIQQAMDILESQIARTRFLSIVTLKRMEKSWREHEAIIEAVLRRDPHEAEQKMRSHIRAVYQNLTENLGRVFGPI